MQITVVTLFPELFSAFAGTSLVGKAIAANKLELAFEDLRPHGRGKYKSVDDTPYGGGSGMVMRVDCLVSAIEAARSHSIARPLVALMSPQGRRFCQPTAEQLAKEASLVLVCGRYEGYDERVKNFVDLELSLGDFILCGGEVAAQAVIEATVRLLPGVIGNADSLSSESFSHACSGGLEYPQYTRPPEFRGHQVPDVLLSGDHARIEQWRREQAGAKTQRLRPDLYERHDE